MIYRDADGFRDEMGRMFEETAEKRRNTERSLIGCGVAEARITEQERVDAENGDREEEIGEGVKKEVSQVVEGVDGK